MDHKLYLMEHEMNNSSASWSLQCIIDNYLELVWTDRYTEYGDFELKLPANSKWLNTIHENQYLMFNESEHVMIIESISIEENSETGDYIIVSGRSLESLLDRRIIWWASGTSWSGQTLAGLVKDLIISNITSPSGGTSSENNNRKIPQFLHYGSGSSEIPISSDSSVLALTLSSLGINASDVDAYQYQNLYEIVKSLCQTAEIGFKVVVYDSQEILLNNKFFFSLYNGVDRSFSQSTNSYVIFSQKMGNMTSSKYVSSNKTERNFIRLHYTKSDGTEYTVNYPHAGWTQPIGIMRREMYLDAGSEATGKKIMDAQKAALRDNAPTTAFEAEIDPTKIYKYGTDYSIGDIVQFENKYGMKARVRVSEMVFSVNQNEFKAYPTFEQISEEE